MQRSLERTRRRSRAHTRSVLLLRRPCREVQIGCSGFRLLRGCDRDRDQVRLEDGDMDRSCVWCCKRLLHSGRRLYTFFEVMLSSSFDEARPRQFLFLHWINSINSISTVSSAPYLSPYTGWRQRVAGGSHTWKHRAVAAAKAAVRIYVHPRILNSTMAAPMVATTMGSMMTRWT